MLKNLKDTIHNWLVKFYISNHHWFHLRKKDRWRIESLDYTFARRRKEAIELSNNCKATKRKGFAIHSITIFEVFFLEEFNWLKAGLDRIYTDRDRHDTRECVENYEQFFENFSGDFSFGGWVNLRAIGSCEARKNKSYYPGYFGAVIDNFPNSVKAIEVSLVRVSPSAIGASFDVILSDEVNQKLDELMNSVIGGDLRFFAFLPWRNSFSSHCCLGTKQKVILDFLKVIRIDVENFLSNYFKGFFLGAKKDDSPACPFVEYYVIDEFSVPEKLDEKYKAEKDFWDSLSFPWYFKDMIYFKDYMYLFDTSYYFDLNKNPMRILFIKQYMSGAIKLTGSFEGALCTDKRDFFVGNFKAIALLNIVHKTWDTLNKFRYSLSLISREKLSIKAFQSLMKLHNEVSQEHFFLNRLQSEFLLMTDNLHWWNRDSIDFRLIKDISKPENERHDIIQDQLERLKKQFQYLESQHNVLQESIKQYLAGQSINMNYKLQTLIIFISVLAVILTLCNILICNWETIKLVVS